MVGWVKKEYITECSESSNCIIISDETTENNFDLSTVKDSTIKIEEVIKTAFASRANADNFVFIVESQVNNGQTEFMVTTEYILTTIREPKEDPLIVGMYQAMAQYTDDKQKQAAQKIIDGYIAEMRTLGERSQESTQVKVITNKAGQSELLFVYTNDGVTMEMPLEEYLIKEDSDQRIQMGKELLIRDME